VTTLRTRSNRGKLVQTVGITGANGYVGSRIAADLEAAGFRVVALVREPRPDSSDRRYALDIDHADDLLSGLDILIQCAWDMRVSVWEDVKRINIDGSIRLIDAAIKADINRVIFISSMSAYEGCQSCYGRAKQAVESRLRTMSAAMVIRPGLIYGEQPGGIVGTLLGLAKKSPVLPMVGLGKFKLYTCHEQDLTKLVTYCCQLSEPTARTMDKEILAAEPTGREFRKIVSCLAGRKLVFVPVPWRLAWFGLRVLEFLGLYIGLKSDSLIGLVKSDPCPDFSSHQHLPFSFRPLVQQTTVSTS